MRKLLLAAICLLLMSGTAHAANIAQAMLSVCKVGGCAWTYDSELAISANATDDSGGSEADAITDWTDSNASLDSVTTAPQSGSYHLSASADAASDKFSRAISGLSASTLYKLSFYARHTGSGGDWRCYGGRAATVYQQYVTPMITSADTTYAQHNYYFYYNANQDTIICIERSDTNDGGIYLDNYSLKAVTSSCLGSEINTASDAATIGANEADAYNTWATSGLLDSITTDPQNGSYHIEFKSNATAGAYFSKDLSAILTEGKTYFVSFYASNFEGDSVVCGVSPLSNVSKLGTVDEGSFVDVGSSSWVHFGFSFTYSASSTRYFGCRENGSGNDAGVYLDGLSITEVQ